jgi:hypothetical protein
MARFAAVLLAAAAKLLLLPRAAFAANVSEPHPHQGLIPRLKLDGKPNIKLSSTDLKAVEAGELWMKSKEESGIGRGIGVRDIAAPIDVVFGQISDLEAYVGKVPMLRSLKIYERKKKSSVIIEKATYIVKVIPGYNFEYYVEHHADKKKGVVLFFLDYGRHSDFSDMQGKWYLEEHPTKAGWTRVYYQCDLKLWGYAPAIVKKLLTSKGLSSAISWVKKESEKRAPKSVGTAAFAIGLPPLHIAAPTSAATGPRFGQDPLTNLAGQPLAMQYSTASGFIAVIAAGIAAAHVIASRDARRRRP